MISSKTRHCSSSSSLLCLSTIFLLLLVLLSKAQDAPPQDFDDSFEDETDDGGGATPTEENMHAIKEKYVPPPFQKPMVDAQKFHMLELFEDTRALGKQWLKSEAKKEGVDEAISKYNGEWSIGSPTDVVLEGDYGLIVRTKARHHAISSKLRKPFNFDGKPLIVQYEVKYEEGQECGGGYLKLLRQDVSEDLKNFNDQTPYVIMFGPDKCGMTSKIHLILKHKNPKNGTVSEHQAKQSSRSVSNFFEDKKTHLYTLVIKPDNTFRVSVDRKELMSGGLVSDLEPAITPPKEVADPEDKKPEEWDDRAQIVDAEAKKPEDWDESQPKEVEDAEAVKPADWLEEEDPLVPDPEAEQPADWDAEMDGEWEARKVPNLKCKDVSGCGPWKRPMKTNPLYKGKWTAPKIKNPNYKGAWSPRLIENPAFFEADPYKQLESIGAVGIELWTMSSGIVFDNIIVANDESLADELANLFELKQTQEKLFQSVSGPTKGLLQSSMDKLEESPWLWIVIILAVLIPTILVFVFCFGRKSPTTKEHPKKTDEHVEDDEREDWQEGDADPEAEEGADEEYHPSSSSTGAAEIVFDDQQKQQQQKSSPARKRKESSASSASGGSKRASPARRQQKQKEAPPMEDANAAEQQPELVELADSSSPRPARRQRPRRQE